MHKWQLNFPKRNTENSLRSAKEIKETKENM